MSLRSESLGRSQSKRYVLLEPPSHVARPGCGYATNSGSSTRTPCFDPCSPLVADRPRRPRPLALVRVMNFAKQVSDRQSGRRGGAGAHLLEVPVGIGAGQSWLRCLGALRVQRARGGWRSGAASVGPMPRAAGCMPVGGSAPTRRMCLPSAAPCNEWALRQALNMSTDGPA